MDVENTQTASGTPLAGVTGYAAEIERHTDGTLWIKCVGAEPKPGKLWNGLNVYHGDATVIETDGSVGWDEKFKCPHCGDKWWVECDG